MLEIVATILLALLVAAIAILGMMNKSHFDMVQTTSQKNFDQLWSKLDRVTNLMMQKEESVRTDIRSMRDELSCQGKAIERVKGKVES